MSILHAYKDAATLVNASMWSKRCMWACRSRAIFNDPSLEDLGTFSCVVTNTDGMSSSFTLTEDGESDFLHLLVLLQNQTSYWRNPEPRGRTFIFTAIVYTPQVSTVSWTSAMTRNSPVSTPPALLLMLCKVYGNHCLYAIW